jgi:peroxiredoxin
MGWRAHEAARGSERALRVPGGGSGGEALPVPRPAPASPASLPRGSAAPAFELPDLQGGRRARAGFGGRRVLLLFFNPRCGFCTRMGADLAALAVDGAEGRPIPLVVTTGEVEANRQLVAEYGLAGPVLLQNAMEVASQYQCNGTPMGYLIDEQGQIASEMAIGAPALLALAGPGPARREGEGADGGSLPHPLTHHPLRGYPPSHPLTAAGALGGQRELSESKIQRDGLPPGTRAPAFRLPLLHGGELSLADYPARRVLLVFSDPNCGPCDQLLPQLEQLARRTAEIQVLMVSRGDPEANRAKAAQHGLTFPIVLQQQWEVSKEYAKFATPIGYLIDEEGIIAQEVAVGVGPILALLSRPAAAATNGRGPVARPAEKLARRR